MKNNTDINNLSNEIVKQLHDYTENIVKKVKRCARKCAESGVEELHNTSPKLSGDYSK